MTRHSFRQCVRPTMLRRKRLRRIWLLPPRRETANDCHQYWASGLAPCNRAIRFPTGASAADYAKGGSGKPAPYHGYYYRILTRQGAEAAGGAYDYTVRGRMIGGHAVVAWPAVYGNSGVMTFMVNHDGVVYEKDLGPETAATAKTQAFNPDSTWKKAGS
jgi:hypothetical protein